MDQFWIKEGDGHWKEVSEAGFISAERNAGFRAKTGNGRATNGFGSSNPKIKGRVISESIPRESYREDTVFMQATAVAQK